MSRNGKPTLYGVLIGALLALMLAPCARAEVREEFHQSYALTANGHLALSNINGNVTITAWDRNEVKVDAVKRASDQQKLTEAKIVVDAHPDAIKIETQYPHHQNYNPASVDYNITVPRNARLDEINLVNGSVVIDGVAGDVKANSVNGTVRATHLSGRVNLSTVNGHVEAAFDKLARNDVHLNSVNGTVTLTIPSNADADISAATVSGRISNDFGLPLKNKHFVGRSLQGKIGNGGTQLSLNTVNGTIAIRHANDGKPLSKITGTSGDEDESKL